MKLKDIITYSLLFLVSIAFTAEIVFFQLTGRHVIGNSKHFEDHQLIRCSDTNLKLRKRTNDPQLKIISKYEDVCGSQFLSYMMLFTGMPISRVNAHSMADVMTQRLNAFDDFEISPIVIMEPDSEWGLVDFNEYSRGDYDEWIDAYFERLKMNGITDEQLGIWIPFPEPQQPFWNNNQNPDDYAISINRHFKQLKKYFPKATTGILLDSQVGSDESASQLVAYTRLIEPQLINYVGLQGFPWHPTAEGDSRSAIISASEFIPAYMLEEVANSLGKKEVIINTGTYRRRKASSGGEVAVSTQQRMNILKSVEAEVDLLESSGFNVIVNIFSEDKFELQEGVDWSYWESSDSAEDSHAALFTNFVNKLINSGAEISIYDSSKNKNAIVSPDESDEINVHNY